MVVSTILLTLSKAGLSANLEGRQLAEGTLQDLHANGSQAINANTMNSLTGAVSMTTDFVKRVRYVF
jgi:hypothetical protein